MPSSVPLRKPIPLDEDAQIYIMVQLFHADGDLKWRSPTIKADFTPPYVPSFPSESSSSISSSTTSLTSPRDKLDLTLSADESRDKFKFTWQFDAGDGSGPGSVGDMSLTFIRFLIVHNIKRERDVKLGVYCVNVAGWQPGTFFSILYLACFITLPSRLRWLIDSLLGLFRFSSALLILSTTGLQALRLTDPNGNFTNASLLVRTEMGPA